MLHLGSVVRFADLDRWDSPRASDTTAAYKWPAVKLGDIADVRLGIQVPRKGDDARGGVLRPYLRAANVRRGRVDTSEVKEMYLAATQASDLALRRGDLLFVEGSGSVSEVGRSAIWDSTIDEIVHQNSVIRARPRADDIDRDFLMTWFNSRAGNRYIRQVATTTSGLYHIGAAKLVSAPLPVPPLSLQHQLVRAYRSTLVAAEDAKIQSMALLKYAWVKFCSQVVDAPEIASDTQVAKVVRFASLERWDMRADAEVLRSRYPMARLNEIADIRLGAQLQKSNTGGEDVPYVRVANVQRGYLDLTDLKTMNVSAGAIDRLRLERDDLLFLEANSLEEVGRCARWGGELPVCIHQNHVIRARLHDVRFDPKFVEAWFNSPQGGLYVRMNARTNSGSLYTIPVGVLALAPVPVVPLADQGRLLSELKEGLYNASAAMERAGELREQAEVDLESALMLSDSSGG